MAMMQSYKNNTALAGADTKNGIPTMKRSFNNNPLALSADFNNASLKGLGNSGSGTNFNFKLPAMNIGGPKDSQNYNNMTRNSQAYNPKGTDAIVDKSNEEMMHVDRHLNTMLADTLKNRKSQVRLF